MRKEQEARRPRRTTYMILVLVAMSITAGRMANVINKEGTTAFLSANDRSRWATVSSLIEDGTYVIDRQITMKDDRGKTYLHTIDLVRHRGDDGKLHYYSSKPPLLASLVAVVYGSVHFVTGLTLTDQPIYVTRLVLMLVNLPMLLLFYAAMIYSIELVGRGDWSRRMMAAVICFGTMVTPFAVSLTNHLPAATATALVLAIYLYASERLDGAETGEPREPNLWIWFLAGLGAAFAVANELPALSMMCLWVVLFAMLSLRSVARSVPESPSLPLPFLRLTTLRTTASVRRTHTVEPAKFWAPSHKNHRRWKLTFANCLWHGSWSGMTKR